MLDRLDEGRETISGIFLEDPENPEYIYRMAWAYYVSDLFESCILLSLEIETDPGYREYVLPMRAYSYYMLGMNDKSLEDIINACELQPEDAYNWYLRGIIENAMKRYRQAEADFTRAILLDGRDSDSYYERGMVRFFLKERGEACIDWGVAAGLDHAEALDRVKCYCNELEF
jgi:tetratricopeptide (TPR) repeat protein